MGGGGQMSFFSAESLMKTSGWSKPSSSVRVIIGDFGTAKFQIEIWTFPCVYYGILDYHLRLPTIRTVIFRRRSGWSKKLIFCYSRTRLHIDTQCSIGKACKDAPTPTTELGRIEFGPECLKTFELGE